MERAVDEPVAGRDILPFRSATLYDAYVRFESAFFEHVQERRRLPGVVVAHLMSREQFTVWIINAKVDDVRWNLHRWMLTPAQWINEMYREAMAI